MSYEHINVLRTLKKSHCSQRVTTMLSLFCLFFVEIYVIPPYVSQVSSTY